MANDSPDDSVIRDETALRAGIGPVRALAAEKVLDHLDAYALRFIALSPFLVLASADGTGDVDASPRGDAPASWPPRRPHAGDPRPAGQQPGRFLRQHPHQPECRVDLLRARHPRDPAGERRGRDHPRSGAAGIGRRAGQGPRDRARRPGQGIPVPLRQGADPLPPVGRRPARPARRLPEPRPHPRRPDAGAARRGGGGLHRRSLREPLY